MSLTIDYVTMPPKSQEASQIQTNEITRMEHENQEVASQFQQQVKKNSEQTIRRNKAENEELKNEERKKKKQDQKRQSGKRNAKEKSSQEKSSSKDGHFDMLI